MCLIVSLAAAAAKVATVNSLFLYIIIEIYYYLVLYLFILLVAAKYIYIYIYNCISTKNWNFGYLPQQKLSIKYIEMPFIYIVLFFWENYLEYVTLTHLFIFEHNTDTSSIILFNSSISVQL